jgi:ribosomal protein S18 acetylase RimI-like enzyme
MFNKPLIAVRRSRPSDTSDITDIDVKSFEIAWTNDYWYELLNKASQGGNRSIFVATWYGNTVGFAVMRFDGKDALIEKLAVKQHYRRKGISTHLLSDATMFAQDRRCNTLSLIVPESSIYPDETGQLPVAVLWAKAVGFKATIPLIKDYFKAYGEMEDGVRFTAPIE